MIEIWGPKLTSVLGDIEGIKEVRQYDELPGRLVASPTIIWLPTMAPELSYGLSAPTVLITQVQITLYVNATLLPNGVGLVVPLIGKVMRALAVAMTLDGTVSYILPRADGAAWEGPASLTYGQDVYTGVNFFYNVKEVLDFAVSA